MFLSTAAGGFLAAPLAPEAQQAKKVWRSGHLEYAYLIRARDFDAFWSQLRALGYAQGRNLVIESRVSDSSFERLHGPA